jgi:hypothetical protein
MQQGSVRPPARPRWVVVLAVVLGVAVLLIVVVLVVGGGNHGPGRHTSPGHDSGKADAVAAGPRLTGSQGRRS